MMGAETEPVNGQSQLSGEAGRDDSGQIREDLEVEEAVSHSNVEALIETLRVRLGLGAESDAHAILLAAQDRLQSLVTELNQRAARERVEGAFRAGKLSGAQQEWAMQLAIEHPESFDAWLSSAPVLVSIGRMPAPSEAAGGGRNHAAIAAAARAEYEAEPALASITSEEAWVEDALRQAGA